MKSPAIFRGPPSRGQHLLVDEVLHGEPTWKAQCRCSKSVELKLDEVPRPCRAPAKIESVNRSELGPNNTPTTGCCGTSLDPMFGDPRVFATHAA